MNETKETANLIAELRKRFGCLILNIHGGYYQQAGWPDTFICHPKLTCFVEFKTQTGKVKPLQRRVCEQLRDRGMPTFIVRILKEQYNIMDSTGRISLRIVDKNPKDFMTGLKELIHGNDSH